MAEESKKEKQGYPHIFHACPINRAERNGVGFCVLWETKT